ncbi:hypothetical protein [Saccharomonospora sp. CUA-673]|uniref:hypothetical protein n=1 Tax=Saccharomonospora sp. CUA-673 TaxID=1904969 RepID=UPI0021017CC7|nr:hypothetical protein [Saccharomonospora sp. CUA-673]
MADAGHGGGLELTLKTTTAYPGMDDAATVIARQLEPVGIDVTVDVVSQDTFWTEVYAQAPFYVSYLGGISFLDVTRVALLPDSPTNETAWGGNGWGDRFDQAMAEKDEAARNAALGELQREVADDGGYVVWAAGDGLDLARPEVSGLPTGPGFQRLFIDRVRLESP